MNLFPIKVAGLQPATFFEKDSCTHVFLYVLLNILEHISWETHPGKTSDNTHCGSKSGLRLVIKLLARTGKYKLGARARAGNQAKRWGPSKNPGSGKYEDPFLLKQKRI